MPGHPDRPADAPAPKEGGRRGWWDDGNGVPAGMELDNQSHGDEGYGWMDGIPIATKLTSKFRGWLQPKLELATRFHPGQQ